MQQLYYQIGCLSVTARGYWFSGGGEKGSFGYYPHLKDAEGRPFYPDTQLRGDLGMACRWLLNLEAQTESAAMLQRMLGDQGDTHTALLACTDLCLCDASRKKWGPERFQIKPTIQITSNTRTVAHQMLAAREAAYLEGLTLQADLYLGYTEDVQTLERMRNLLEGAIELLSGFGARRSRGFGRGALRIAWQPPAQVAAATADQPDAPPNCQWHCFLQALTNFRNKPVEPGAAQTLATRTGIESTQLRGWLVRMYRKLYGVWPTPVEMQELKLMPLYPALVTKAAQGATRAPGLPSPVSTMQVTDPKTQTRVYKDFFSLTPDNEEAEATAENFFRPKLAGVGPGAAVSAGEPLQIFFQPTAHRMRNRMDDKFITEENGLFMQELVPAGSWFGGRLGLSTPLSSFGRRIWQILRTGRPVLRGAWFNCFLDATVNAEASSAAAFGLVVRSQPFDPMNSIHPIDASADSASVCLRITSQIRYHAPLGRPRRNRICIAPGSIVLGSDEDRGIVAWPGFGQELTVVLPAPASEKLPQPAPPPTLPAAISKLIAKDVLSRAQAGFFRQLQHPHLDNAQIERILDQRMEKFEGKEGHKELVKIYQALRRQPQYQDKQQFIAALRIELATRLWQRKAQQKGNKPS